MNKNAIKKYAIWARNELIDRVLKRALRYGISADGKADPKAESIDGKILTKAEQKQRAALIGKIEAHGYEQTMEEVAYTWFNRFAALRFMEVNGYLPSHVRVFTNDAGEFKPQILAEAINLDLPGLDKEKVYALRESNSDEELFRYLLIVQCNALSEILSGMFQRLDDFTELLLPDNLLREGSVIERLVKQGESDSIPEDDWRDQVQIIGWLYQYYNTEPKDKVFADLKKNIKVTKEKIPVATQLFTPDWIVRYMVENSLGRLWLDGHPNESLQAKWKYYLPEAEQEESVQKQLAEIRKEYANIKPEDIRCIDPCMGSGHILCYLFDVLVQIYEDYGHTARDAVALILQNNLYGLDIDDRAAQLAYFAVMMKARQYDRRFFSRRIQPHVMAIQESNGLKTWHEVAGDSLVSEQLTFDDDYIRIADYLIETFHDAKEYGSILTVEPDQYDTLLGFIERMKQEDGNLLFKTWIDDVEKRILPLIRQAKMLSANYNVVVTNPPYMGSSNMEPKLLDYVSNHYPDSKADLFAVCIERGNNWVAENGYNCMVTMQSWMFLSSFERMRVKALHSHDIACLMHMENMVMGIAFGTTVTSFRNSRIHGYKGTYNHIKYEDIVNDTPKEFPISVNIFTQVDAEKFSKIPGMPVAYWISDNIRELFSIKTIKDYSISDGQNKTGNNDRFMRYWWEVESEFIGKDKWILCARGGAYRKWYGNIKEVIDWSLSARNHYRKDRVARIIPEYIWYKEGFTWSRITSYKPSYRIQRDDMLFEMTGLVLFWKDNVPRYYILGLLNSIVSEYLLQIITQVMTIQLRDVQAIPVLFESKYSEIIGKLVRENIIISNIDWDSFETSWEFEKPSILSGYKSLTEAYAIYKQNTNERFTTLKSNEEDLNRIFIDIYGLADELTPDVADKDVTIARIYDTKEELPDSMKGNNYVLTKADVMKSLISYAVGCMMGRYSLDTPGLVYAGGEWDATKYKTFPADEDAIIPICDDEYFDDDIVNRFAEFIEVVFGKETLEENLQFISDTLGGRGTSREVIRNYFLTGFYADHVKTYQKRPIYWLFDSGKKNGFKCLVYMHRYRPDTIARIRTDYVHEQQSRYRTAIESLEQARDNAATAGEKVKLSKKLAAVEAQAKELREYEEKIHHLADQMITIDLDDGVKHNYAIFKDVLAKIK